MRLSIARSLATAMVRPSGSKDACATQDAIMALATSARFAVTTYSPLLSLPSAFATSTFIALALLMLSFFVSACAMSVPASSYSWYTCKRPMHLCR
jgi:hypothetical protein